MDTKALRQKILDLAIRGKLVPQDPNDEPASVLLERIRAEKQQMVKDGKLKEKDLKNDTVIFKGEDSLHYEKFPDGKVKCIEDEIPFELPQGWEWARLSSVCIVNPKNTIDESTEVSFIPMSLIQEGFSNKHTYEIRKWSVVKTGFTHFAENDVGIAKITPCFENRKSVVFKNLKNGYGAGTTELHIVRTLSSTITPDFVLWLVKSESFISRGVQNFSGAVGQQRVGKDFISNYLIPLPSYNEQKRIVSIINGLFDFITSIEFNQSALLTTIDQAKSKILDLAIRGKLVPQDPSDEPASVLLERIRAEKEELIKQGKIKRDKKESVIFKGEDNSYYETIGSKTACIDDEIPFELPDGWEWCRLESVFNVCSAKRVLQSEWKTEGIPFYRAREIVKLSENDYVDNELFISETHYKKLALEYGVPKDGDIMVSGVGTIGKIYVVKRKDRFYYKDASVLCFENISKSLYPKYARFMLESSYLQKQMKENSKGTTVDTITINAANNYLIIIPPINEQKRIADKIDQLFSALDTISASLN